MPAAFSRTCLRLLLGLVLVATFTVFRSELYPALANSTATYSVKAGDTLFSIGAGLGVGEDRLSSWAAQVVSLNGLQSADVPRIGQELTLPGSAGASPVPSGRTSSTGGTTTYTVKAGDTLLAIADRHNVPASSLTAWLDQVISINGLAGADALQMGETLRLPAATSGPSSVSTAAAGGSGSSTTYLVKAGDTLQAIAERQGVPPAQRQAWMREVVALNGLAGVDTLRMADSLRLPIPGTNTTSTSTTTAAPPDTEIALHVVKSGDTLYGIAGDNGVKEADLVSWISRVLQLNEMTSTDKLTIGDRLRLPAGRGAAPSTARSGPESLVSYTVRAGDTLSAIGEQHGVAAAEMQTWTARVLELNSLASASALRQDEVIRIPARQVAASTAVTQVRAGTTAYSVKPGDTLSDIAKSSGIPESDLTAWLSKVIELNSLPGPEALRAGAVLQLPGAPVTAPAVSTASTNQAASWSATDTVTYAVQAGETLDSIARKSGVAPSQLPAWIARVEEVSRIDRKDPLLAGEILLIPAPSSAPAPAAAPRPEPTAPRPSGTQVRYVVKAGDSLADIAATHGIEARRLPGWIEDVARLNSLAAPERILAGSELLLPDDTPSRTPAAPVAASPGATASAIATASASPPRAPVATPVPRQTGTSTPGLIRGPNGSCFYTVQAADSWEGIAQKLNVPADKRDAWIASIRDLNGLANGVLPVGDGLRMLC